MNITLEPQRLATATSPDAADTPVLLVPVGSLEQHGPHLPLNTDTVIAQAVADGCATRLIVAGKQCQVAPAVCYGSSGEHQTFAGTVSVGTEVLHQFVVELVRSARTWATRVVLVNGHGGNATALDRAIDQLTWEGHDVLWSPCAIEGVDLHAGRCETSLMLHVRPETVRLDLAETGDTRPLADILPQMSRGGIEAVSTNGVLGDPTGASAEEGARVLTAMVDKTVAVLAGAERTRARK